MKASNTGAGDRFGSSIALAGDTLVVGAPYEASAAMGINGDQTDNSASQSGAVYVFTRDPVTRVWSQQAYLKASNTGAGDHFGVSVALAGETLAVGAWLEASAATGISGDQTDNSASQSGAVYVFTRDAVTNIWSQQAYVKASNTEAGDRFGYGVALAGDTLVVGAPNEASPATGISGNQSDNSAPQSGAVYVFTRDAVTNVWSQQAYVKASNTEAGDWFGYSVALAGNSLAVGAWGEASAAKGINGNQADNSAPQSGAVYVFTRDAVTNVWSQQAYVKASNTGVEDFFGAVVSLAGDKLAVGAEREDSAAKGINGNQTNNSRSDSGAVYVFIRDPATGVWSQQAYVKASNTDAEDSFGWSIALDGDRLAVGAPREDSIAFGANSDQTDNNADDSGAVYVFRPQ